DRDGAALLLVEAIGERRGRRLVDNAENFETRDLARVLGRLALGVVEVGGNRDDSLLDLGTEIGFGRFFHLLQDESGNLGRRILILAVGHPGVAVRCLYDAVGNELLVLFDGGIVIAPSDQALHREESLFGIRDRLALGRLADQ